MGTNLRVILHLFNPLLKSKTFSARRQNVIVPLTSLLVCEGFFGAGLTLSKTCSDDSQGLAKACLVGNSDDDDNW